MSLLLTPETQLRLTQVASRRGVDTETLIQTLLDEEERNADLKESCAAIAESFQDIEAGRTRRLNDFIEEQRKFWASRP